MDSLEKKKTLLEIRKEQNIKQRVILDLLHIDRKTLYNWEHCITAPDHWQLQALCKFYGIKKVNLQLAPRYDPWKFLPDDTTYDEWKMEYDDTIRAVTLHRPF